MPVSGLVVSLGEEPQSRAEALAVIGREPQITMGVLEGSQLAIVLDTASSEEDKRLWQWLDALPGVLFVEVAFVGFEQVPPEQAPPEQVRSATPRNSTLGRKDDTQDGR